MCITVSSTSDNINQLAHFTDPFATVATRNHLKLGVAWARGGIVSGTMGGEIYVAESD